MKQIPPSSCVELARLQRCSIS